MQTIIRKAEVLVHVVGLVVLLCLIAFAVAKGQDLHALDKQVAQNAVRISEIERRVNELDKKDFDVRLARIEAIGENNRTFLLGLAFAMLPITYDALKRVLTKGEKA